MVQLTTEALEHYNKIYPGVNNKIHMLDIITPFYKGKLDNLSPRSQHIIHILAEKAAPLSTGEIARKLRAESKNVSVTLSQLVEKGMIQRRSVNSKNYEYFIDDQIFLDWSAMRWGFKRDWK